MSGSTQSTANKEQATNSRKDLERKVATLSKDLEDAQRRIEMIRDLYLNMKPEWLSWNSHNQIKELLKDGN